MFREMPILLRLNFVSFKVSHANRVCNKAAHCIAAISSNQNEARLLWRESVPDGVIVVVASES
jgi:hypothetical protein